MTFSKKTLQDCLQSLADRHDNGTIPAASATVSFYTRQINRGVAYCADRLRLSADDTITIASGVGNLPDDFIIMGKVFDSGNIEFVMVDPDDLKNHTGFVYWITGNQIDGFVLNIPTDGDYSISYSFRPADMVNTTDVCVIPDIEAPTSYAYSVIRKGESDPFEDAEKSMHECDSRLAEIQSQNSINNDSINFDWNI